MQQNSRPSGAKRDFHHPGRSVLSLKIYQRDAQRFFRLTLPVGGCNQFSIVRSTTSPRRSAFAPPVFFHDDRDIKPRHGPRFRQNAAFRAENRNLLQLPVQRGRHLHDTFIPAS